MGKIFAKILFYVVNISSQWKIAIFSAVFTSGISIIGIYLTIKHNEKMITRQIQSQDREYLEDKRLQIMPYIKYDLVDTLEDSELGHETGGVSFHPYGFINGGNGPSEQFFSKMKIVNKLLMIKNVGKNPCIYFKVLQCRADETAERKSYRFPFEISVLEVNETSDMFIQTGIPKELPETSSFKTFEEIPQNYPLYLDICYGDILGNYYEQTIEFSVFASLTIYTDGSSSDFTLDMRIASVSIPNYVKEKNIFKDAPKTLEVIVTSKWLCKIKVLSKHINDTSSTVI